MSIFHFNFNPLPEVQFWHYMYLLIADELENLLKILGTELESILFSRNLRLYVLGLSFTMVGIAKFCVQKYVVF